MPPLRVHLLQPRVMAYRLPVMRALAGAPGVRLTVWADLSAKGAVDRRELMGFESRDAPIRWIGPFSWQRGALEAVRNHEADVAILSWQSRALDVPIALRSARRRGVATVLWGHGFGKTHPRLGDLARRLTADIADACLLYGPATRRRTVGRGVPPEKVFDAPNAIDQSSIATAATDWRSRPDDLAAFRSQQGLHGPVVLFLSRLEADKNPPLLAEAFAKVLAKHPDATLVFVGDGSARSETEAAVDRLGVRDRVRFAGATYDESKIAPWALSASVLVHPGGIGLSLMHAFGYGVPVITTDRMYLHGPEVEILDADRNGLFFRDGDATDLAEKVLSLLGDPARLKAMSAAAFETVDGPTGRNIPAMVAGFLEAIDFAAARHGKSRV
jgi:glycosyltransferase involved in cell wall biosynthesis